MAKKKDNYDTGGYIEYIWKYFELHANQRIALFRFYVIFFTLFSYAIAHIIVAHGSRISSYVVATLICILSVLFLFITFIFWKLDSRNRTLVHYAEDFFEKYENKFKSEDNDPFRLNSLSAIQVFTRERSDTKNGKSICRHTFCFKCIFILGGALAVIFFLLAIGILMGWLPHSIISKL